MDYYRGTNNGSLDYSKISYDAVLVLYGKSGDVLLEMQKSNLAERLRKVLNRGVSRVDPRTYLGYNQ